MGWKLYCTKLSAGQIAPTAMAFYRWLMAVLVLFPFVARPLWQERHNIYSHVMKFAILGLLGMATFQVLAYFSAQTTSATNISIITAAIPLFTLFLSNVVLREAPTRGAVVGCLLSFVGLILVIGQGDFSRIWLQGMQPGDRLIIIASFAYAGYNVMLRHWPIPLSCWPSLWLQAFFDMIFLLPGFLLGPPTNFTIHNMSLILYAGLLACLIAPICWMISIKNLGVNRTSIFINLAPIITMIIAVTILNEPLTLYHIGGTILTLLGVVFTQIWHHPLSTPSQRST